MVMVDRMQYSLAILSERSRTELDKLIINIILVSEVASFNCEDIR